MVPARDASTVVVVRPDGNRGFQILLTQRPAQMRFLGGYYVFPGGTVRSEDYSPNVLERCLGLSADDAGKMLGRQHAPEEALGHWTAVIRELFEEVGVLLCVAESGDGIDLRDEPTKKRLEVKRRAIANKELDFGAFLDSENFFCDLSRIVYFDHWVTPEIYSMRFDTRFYMAALPANQIPLTCSEEVTHSLWVNSQEIVSRAYRQDLAILPPTTTVLQKLAQFDSWARLRAAFALR
jgi:8-oxo-dGTP pyrophosphatase MutT (NUDIX family)